MIKNSFTKKIECPEELREILTHIFNKNKNYINNQLFFLPLDGDLVISSVCHESLLKGCLNCWAYFNGEEWDSVIIGFIIKNEKINKKIYSEYIHLANSMRGIFLIKNAIRFAKTHGCEYFFMSSSKRNKNYANLKRIFKKLNFESDLETFALKL